MKAFLFGVNRIPPGALWTQQRIIFLIALLLGGVGTTIGQTHITTTVSPVLKNPTLIITKINPAAVNTDAPIGVYFTFRNDSQINPVIRTGTIAVSIHKDGSDNTPATVSASVFNVKALAIGQSISGYLILQTPGKGGEWLVDVRYNEPLAVSGGLAQKNRVVTITNVYAAIQVTEDKDADGIDDNTEAALLARFRPYFMFSNDGGEEGLAPADALWYLTKSELLSTGDENKADNHKVISHTTLVNDPNALIFHSGPLGSSDVVQNPHFSGYHINPIEKLSGEPDNAGRKGESWEVVLGAKNIGLYGHVVPVKLNNPDSFSFEHIYQDGDAGKTYYKIEYWQLFGYNDAHQSYIGNHEGDWASL